MVDNLFGFVYVVVMADHLFGLAALQTRVKDVRVRSLDSVDKDLDAAAPLHADRILLELGNSV